MRARTGALVASHNTMRCASTRRSSGPASTRGRSSFAEFEAMGMKPVWRGRSSMPGYIKAAATASVSRPVVAGVRQGHGGRLARPRGSALDRPAADGDQRQFVGVREIELLLDVVQVGAGRARAERVADRDLDLAAALCELQ